MEPLSDLLRSLQVAGSVYFCAEIGPRWNKVYADNGRASFHAVRHGHFSLCIGNAVSVLGEGDFVYVAPGVTHSLHARSSHGSSAPNDGERRALLCGHCRLHAPAQHPLLRALPSTILLRSADVRAHPWLRRTLELLSREYLSQTPGSELVVDKLTEILVVEVIRTHLRGKEGLALGLRDHSIARSLRLLHDEPQRPWTISTLAHDVALSRAAFARRFKVLVGQGVFEYLTQLRMHRARDLLRGSSASTSRIALEVGYESEGAFARAFRRHVGVTPAQYRQA